MASRGSSALLKSDAASACSPTTVERHAEDLDPLADRVQPGEERLRQLVVDDRDARAGRVLDRREVPPGEDVAAVHLGPGRAEAGDLDVARGSTPS